MASGYNEKLPTDNKNVDLVLWLRHDYFNIVTLPLVFISNTYFLSTADHNDANSFQYKLQSWLFSLYMLIDTTWLIFYPRSVPAPKFIICHHLVSLLGFQMVTWTGDYKYVDIPSELLIVEINTWLLTARRHVVNRYGLFILNLLTIYYIHYLQYIIHLTYNMWRFMNRHGLLILNSLFYMSWVVIRNGFYPLKLYELFVRYQQHSEASGSYINVVLFFLVIVGFLNFLNTKWTVDLFSKNYLAYVTPPAATKKE